LIMDEFAHAQLGDHRLTKRLGQLAADFAHQPQASIPMATGNWGQACAAYRFLDNDRVSPAAILAPHIARTRERAAAVPLVLAVADTTSLNYGDRPDTAGLGPISNSADKAFGLWLHSLLAFTSQGRPLGVLDVQCWARDPARFGLNHQRNRRPLEQKESAKWLRSYRALQTHAAQTPQTRWVFVADREADLYELFELALSAAGAPALLVRAQHDRGLSATTRRLFAHLTRAPLAGQLPVVVPRRNAQACRTATLTMRFTTVRLSAPHLKAERPSLTVWAIEARERHPPHGRNAIHWRLLTTQAVSTLAEAIETLQWYCARWGIEVFHKVLKSGCLVEEAQLETAARLERYVAINLVVAWQVMALAKGGREHPATAISEILEEADWRALVAVAHNGRRQPRGVPTMGQAVRWIARLGGHLGRRGDGAPGPLSLARGLRRLHDISAGWKLAHETKSCA
jgi:hypothetical protein